jgi:hypothetical protein
MRIRKRDGTTIEAPGDYILADGEMLTVPLTMTDARRPMVHDGHGGRAGERPGFLFNDNDERALDEVHRQYREDISQRWKSDRWRSPTPTTPTPPSQPMSREAAYEQYNHDIQNRWRQR